MTKEMKVGIRHHVVAAGRDILVVSAVLSLLGGVVAFATKPFWEPFAQLPVNVANLNLQFQAMSIKLNESYKPRIVDFHGNGKVVTISMKKPGRSALIFYSLRRNVSCDSEVTPVFYNVDRGISIQGETFDAIKAQVTEQYQPFSVSINIPDWLPDGRYIYYPLIKPIDCGIYKEIRVPPSDIFEVTS